MQATHARKAFPCFDEPAMKAVFNVTIIHDRATVALSNGREIGSSQKHRNSVLSNFSYVSFSVTGSVQKQIVNSNKNLKNMLKMTF